MKRLWREPLTQFLVLGVLIFAAYEWLATQRDKSQNTIVVSSAELERMAALFASESGSLPSDKDMQSMFVDHIEQQALAREAQRLGLAEGDTIISRRLAQKMRFMVADLAEIEPASEEVLRDWYISNLDQFKVPSRTSFQHVYFSTNKAEKINAALKKLSNKESAWRQIGEPFMLQREYAELPSVEIARLFGREFANEIGSNANSKTSTWFGPVGSMLGQHLVKVTQHLPQDTPEFEAVRNLVLEHWTQEQSRNETRRAIKAIVERYKIEIAGETYQ